MSLKIIKAGIADSIQDAGRFGFQHLGINPGGTADSIAATVANALVGNESDAAILEQHYPASSIHFTENTCIAISGADFGAAIEAVLLPLNTPIIIKKNAVLVFGKKSEWGCRSYLSAHGGFDVPKWLNSFSTNTHAKAGGFKGRNLKKDDLLNNTDTKTAEDYNRLLKERNFFAFPWYTAVDNFYRNGNTIRIIKGHEFERLTSESKNELLSGNYTIGTQSNRMGYRMQGATLNVTDTQQLLSTAISCGTVQLLPDGQMIILMTDHQTTGGYPRIAHVIAADLPTLAQKNVRQTIQFSLISHEEAEEIYLRQQKYLKQIAEICRITFKNRFA